MVLFLYGYVFAPFMGISWEFPWETNGMPNGVPWEPHGITDPME